jgi:hypothetical protein
VLDAVAGEDLDASVVHVDREVDGELAARLAQDGAHARIEPEPLGGEIELALRHQPGIDGGGNVLGGHVVRRPSWRRVDGNFAGARRRNPASHVRAASIATEGGLPPARWYRPAT